MARIQNRIDHRRQLLRHRLDRHRQQLSNCSAAISTAAFSTFLLISSIGPAPTAVNGFVSIAASVINPAPSDPASHPRCPRSSAIDRLDRIFEVDAQTRVVDHAACIWTADSSHFTR